MATLKKAKGPSMIETFQEFKETKNIDRTTLVRDCKSRQG